ncbi:MAG: amidohydrolase family protein, partial [Cytophagales bacterium]|nr:amidohydrolase family protein [Cytophagales bacterium]
MPPFAEAHNHNINGQNSRNAKAVAKYLADGVFYVKEPGNFYLSDEEKTQLNLNQPTGIDVSLAQGASLTATMGHPYQLAEDVWFKFGYAKGPIDSLVDRRFFTIDSEEDLEKKWPEILRQRPDFIKTILWTSDEYEQRKQNKTFYGQAGLKPEFLARIVEKAHAANLRVSTHINNAHDFHVAVSAGVDEIAHLPITGLTPIAEADAKLAAQRGVVVVTTCSVPVSLPPFILPRSILPQVLQVQKDNLRLLHQQGVTLAIGSDIPSDSSVEEFEYIRNLGLFDNLTLLKMW